MTGEIFQMSQVTSFTWNDCIQLFRATGLTLYITALSIVIGTAVGTVLGLIRCSNNRLVGALPLVVIEPLRNSPLVTQLFLVYFGLPLVSSIVLDPLTAAIAALSLNTAVFFAVLVHSSVSAIPKAQWEAGLALGHSRFSVFRWIIAQQALRLLVPQAITLYIGQLQCSSLVSLLSLMDLANVGRLITARTFKPFLVYTIVFAIYFAISYPLNRLAVRLEKRLSFDY